MSSKSHKFSWYDPLQQLANHLEFRITHAIHIEYSAPAFFHNTAEQNRMILVESVAGEDGGEIEFRDTGGRWRRFALQPRMLYFFPPNLDIKFSYKPGLVCLGYHFNLSLIPGVDLFQGETEGQTMPFNDTATLARLRQAAWDKDNLHDLLWCKGTLLALASQFLKGDIDRHLETMRVWQRYGSIFARIEQAPSINMEWEELATEMNIAPETLARNFKRDAGLSLKTWTTQCVLKEALRALGDSREKFKEISRRLGFSSDAYFNRFIRKHTQKSPGQYRKDYAKIREQSKREGARPL